MFYGNPKVLSSTGTDNCTVNSAIANTQGLSNFFSDKLWITPFSELILGIPLDS